MQNNWFGLFSHFWWLVFPLSWFIMGLFSLWSRHARANRIIDLIKHYADQGKEPPAELLVTLQEAYQRNGRTRDWSGNADGNWNGRSSGYRAYGWVPVFMFAGLAGGFLFMALNPMDEIRGHASGLFFVAFIMGGIAIGNLVAMLTSRPGNRDLPPQILKVSDDIAEQAWVRDAQAGSAQAFSRLVRTHQQGLRVFLRRLCGNAADADDLAQETFVQAFALIGRCDPQRSFRAWLFGIGWRKTREGKRGWLRLLKRESRFAETRETITNPDPGLRLDLATATAALPPDQRAAVLLCLACEFTHAEAAEALALPLGTVKSHVARGREKLIEYLGDADE